jgi:hypothetical protein
LNSFSLSHTVVAYRGIHDEGNVHASFYLTRTVRESYVEDLSCIHILLLHIVVYMMREKYMYASNMIRMTLYSCTCDRAFVLCVVCGLVCAFFVSEQTRNVMNRVFFVFCML